MNRLALDDITIQLNGKLLDDVRELVSAPPELKLGDVICLTTYTRKVLFFHSELRLIIPSPMIEGGLIAVDENGNICSRSPFIGLQLNGVYTLLYNVFEITKAR